MSFKTLSQITSDVVKRIGLVSGAGVQTYTEPQIAVAIQDAFDFVFRKRFWSHLSSWQTFTLTGTTGLVTADLSTTVAEFTDIRDIFQAGTDRRIVRPVKNEHLAQTGNAPIFYTPIMFASDNLWQTKVIKFWPITATGSVEMYVRTHPGVFESSDVVPFPQDIIGWAAAWMVLETDGLNPGNAHKAQTMFDVAYRDYISAISDDVIGVGGIRSRDQLTLR